MRSRRIPGTRNKAATLGILVAALFLTQLPLFPLLVFSGMGNWIYLCSFLHSGMMAALPFVLLKLAPETAGFDRRWLPSGWLQWLGVLPLILLMFVVAGLAVTLTRDLHLGPHRPYYIPTITSFSRLTIVANGFLLILVAPVTEEIFYRGYVLDQLRKLMHWALALPMHAAIFALVHFVFSFTFLLPLEAFFYGLVLGAWRIRFKSLLPLIVAHVTINAVAAVPRLHSDYETLRILEEFQATGVVSADFLDDLRSDPNGTVGCSVRT